MRRVGTVGWMVVSFAGIWGCSSDGTEPKGADSEWTASGGSGSKGEQGDGVRPDGQPSAGGSSDSTSDGGLFYDALSAWDPSATVAGSACQEEMQKPEPYDVVLMLVVDVSGSMTQLAASTNLTKWEPIRRRILPPVSTMPWRGSWARSWRR